MSVYDYQVKNAEGELVRLEEYKGNVSLIVNTATGCGFTPQYKGLEELYEKYKDHGFVILDFPCNQFGNQAPGTQKEIGSFCQLHYGVSFPQFAKIDVNGPNEDPLFTYLKNEKSGLAGKKIKWNFTKFLVDGEGNVLARFSPTTEPEKIEEKIVKLLNTKKRR